MKETYLMEMFATKDEKGNPRPSFLIEDETTVTKVDPQDQKNLMKTIEIQQKVSPDKEITMEESIFRERAIELCDLIKADLNDKRYFAAEFDLDNLKKYTNRLVFMAKQRIVDGELSRRSRELYKGETIEEMADNLARSITIGEVCSARTTNCFLRKGISTLGDVADLSYYQLRNIKGMGKKSIAEITKAMNEHGLTMRGI